MKRFLPVLFALFACTPSPTVTHSAPRAADVASPEALVDAFYAVVNLAPGEARQWDRDRTLYLPGIRFVGLSGDGELETYSHEELIAATEPMIAGGFRERELHRRVRRFGHMVHVDSTYQTHYQDRPHRGVNSIDMVFDGRRWWIASVTWQTESPRFHIPADLLPPG